MSEATDYSNRIAVRRARCVFRNIRLNFRYFVDEFGDAALVEEFLLGFHLLQVEAVLDQAAWW